MSVRRITYLYCDGPICQGKREPWSCAPPTHWNAETQRTKARGDGWTHDPRSRKDYCAECTEKMRGELDNG